VYLPCALKTGFHAEIGYATNSNIMAVSSALSCGK
jgi:hypothetical protein